MRLIVASLFILLATAAVIQLASSTAFDFGSHSQGSDSDAKRLETKMAEILHNIVSTSQSFQAKDGVIDQRLNESSMNSSEINQSINAVSNNTSMLSRSEKPSGLEGSTIVGGTSGSSQELASSSKGAIKGFWGIQASKHVMGQSDIKSHMFLSGSFDVDKTVQFSDKGS